MRSFGGGFLTPYNVVEVAVVEVAVDVSVLGVVLVDKLRTPKDAGVNANDVEINNEEETRTVTRILMIC